MVPAFPPPCGSPERQKLATVSLHREMHLPHFPGDETHAVPFLASPELRRFCDHFQEYLSEGGDPSPVGAAAVVLAAEARARDLPPERVLIAMHHTGCRFSSSWIKDSEVVVSRRSSLAIRLFLQAYFNEREPWPTE